MNERMGIPKGFDFIQEADIPQIIDWALAEANPNYPVPVVYNAARCRKVIDDIRAKAAEKHKSIAKPASHSCAGRALSSGGLRRPAVGFCCRCRRAGRSGKSRCPGARTQCGK